jgi:hypothetical protein
MMQRLFVALLTVVVFMSGYAARMWTDRDGPVPPFPEQLAREYASKNASGDQKKQELNRAQVLAEIEKFRSQISAYSTQVMEIEAEFEREFATILNPAQAQKYIATQKSRAEKAENETKRNAAVRTPLTDEDIRRAQDRPLTSIYWMIVITPHLERRTKDYSLDEAQQASTRSLLNLRRQRYMSLLDSTPHPSIRLSRLAPMLDRITPAEMKQMEKEMAKPDGKN